MECGYSFTELADMHLGLGECSGNATDVVRRCKEMYPNGEIEVSHRTFLPADTPRGGKFSENATGRWQSVVYVVHGWKSRLSRSLKDSARLSAALTCTFYASVQHILQKAIVYLSHCLHKTY
jgi:hypothetical protein